MAGTRLRGKSVIVTGAARGLGLAMTLALVREGARVTMADIDAEALAAAASDAEEAGGEDRVQSLAADVSDEEGATMLAARTHEAFGRIDVLINNAAIGPQTADERYMTAPTKSWLADPEFWRLTLAVNVTGPFLMARATFPHMLDQGWGRIVNVTTALNAMYQPGCCPYGPSKAALEAYTALLAEELEGTGVTANVLIPGGPADTRMIPGHGFFAEREKLIQPERMGPPAVWLASDASDGINGMRFQAALWDDALPEEEAAGKAGAPGAWKPLGLQAIRPDRPHPAGP